MHYSKYSRRQFIYSTSSLALSLLACNGFTSKSKPTFSGSLLSLDSETAHLLRSNSFPEITETINIPYVIVGAGISGLSACRWLSKNNIHNYALLELSENFGGNASCGKNIVSAYPWGAHYLPIPNNNLKEILDFLTEHNAITGYDKNDLPIYNELYLCHTPEERLFIYGKWQEGLIPSLGVIEEDTKEINLFFDLIESYKKQIGTDNKEAFTFPISNCSFDEAYKKLDTLNMSDFLKQKGFSSKYLLWYIDYCCRDDYGTNIYNTSAWAGIHYFAARKALAANASNNDILTWPEGNFWLADKLVKSFSGKLLNNCLTYKIAFEEGECVVNYYDISNKKSFSIRAKKVILSTPQFVNNKLLNATSLKHNTLFSYTPWVVANITLKNVYESSFSSMYWDNVFFKSNSLGYVNANHQKIEMFENKKVITYYWPLTDNLPKTERAIIRTKTYKDLTNEIIADLQRVHKDITSLIENIDIKVLGHGMIRPTPNFIYSEERLTAKNPINNAIFFANSDLSGISVFEEAFYNGIDAANKIIESAI